MEPVAPVTHPTIRRRPRWVVPLVAVLTVAGLATSAVSTWAIWQLPSQPASTSASAGGDPGPSDPATTVDRSVDRDPVPARCGRAGPRQGTVPGRPGPDPAHAARPAERDLRRPGQAGLRPVRLPGQRGGVRPGRSWHRARCVDLHRGGGRDPPAARLRHRAGGRADGDHLRPARPPLVAGLGPRRRRGPPGGRACRALGRRPDRGREGQARPGDRPGAATTRRCARSRPRSTARSRRTRRSGRPATAAPVEGPGRRLRPASPARVHLPVPGQQADCRRCRGRGRAGLRRGEASGRAVVWPPAASPARGSSSTRSTSGPSPRSSASSCGTRSRTSPRSRSPRAGRPAGWSRAWPSTSAGGRATRPGRSSPAASTGGPRPRSTPGATGSDCRRRARSTWAAQPRSRPATRPASWCAPTSSTATARPS